VESPAAGKPRRRYHAPARLAAAARTRAAVVEQAHALFAERGWSGTTIKDVAADAGVSPKTVEALFGTKAALLGAAVDFAIRGDVGETPVIERESGRRVQDAPDAAAMLELHAAHLRLITPRSARIVSVVEHAAPADRAVEDLWQRITGNRRVGVHWATELFLSKPGRPARATRADVEPVFWVTVNWATYRTLTELARLDDDGYENWLRRYYAAMLTSTTRP
jgi:AcrR family transcriptional regulator